MKKTTTLDTKILNPVTGLPETRRILLAAEIDPYSKCILSTKVSFESDQKRKEVKGAPA